MGGSPQQVLVKLQPNRDGSVQLQLDAAEVVLLREVPQQLRMLYDAPREDPARSRLFPQAYLDPTEEEAESEWTATVHPELLRERLEGLERVLAALDAGEERGRRLRVALGPEDVSVWLAVLNDARLAFGSRLEIVDDADVYRIEDGDPMALEKQAYAWLTLLQGELVEVLLRTMPD